MSGSFSKRLFFAKRNDRFLKRLKNETKNDRLMIVFKNDPNKATIKS